MPKFITKQSKNLFSVWKLICFQFGFVCIALVHRFIAAIPMTTYDAASCFNTVSYKITQTFKISIVDYFRFDSANFVVADSNGNRKIPSWHVSLITKVSPTNKGTDLCFLYSQQDIDCLL